MKPKSETGTSKHLPAWKRFVFQAVLLTLSVEGAFLLAEILIRHQEAMETIPLMRENPHGTGSYRLKPDFQYTGLVRGHKTYIRTNPQGMHWYPTPYSPPSDRDRVAFVGDSFTFGCWADDFRCSFVGVFDGALTNKGYEALNFGVVGYGLDDIELILKEEVFEYRPSYVVLMLFNGNDFRDTYLGLNKYDICDGTCRFKKQVIEAKLPREARPQDRRNDSSQFAGTVKAWLTTHSAVARRASRLKREMGARWRSRGSNSFSIDSDFTSFTYWSQVPYPPVEAQARDISMTVLERIHAFVRHQGAKLLLVSIPYAEQVFVHDLEGPHYNAHLPQDFIRDFARDRDIPYLDLLPVLREHVESGRPNPYIPGDPHFNNVGHRVVGEHLAAWFLAERKKNGPGKTIRAPE